MENKLTDTMSLHDQLLADLEDLEEDEEVRSGALSCHKRKEKRDGEEEGNRRSNGSVVQRWWEWKPRCQQMQV